MSTANARTLNQDRSTGVRVPARPGESFAAAAFPVEHLLPVRWRQLMTDVALTESVRRVLRPTSVTSREAPGVDGVPVRMVPGEVVAEKLPWLVDLYHGPFLELIGRISVEAVQPADQDRIKVNLGLQLGGEGRYECHVDSNPVQAVLYASSHTAGEGGQLVVSRDPDAWGVDAIESDAEVIDPVAGQLVVFDGRRFPHYVRALSGATAVRVSAAMNYYTASCTEADRPADLNAHLYG